MVCFLFQYDQRRLSNLWVRSPVVPLRLKDATLRLKDASKVVGRHALLLRRGFHHDFTLNPDLLPTGAASSVLLTARSSSFADFPAVSSGSLPAGPWEK